MPLLSGLDPVAAVAQIAGLDAHGLIALIVRRAETVRRNKYECGQLAQQVEAIGGLLRQVQRDHPAMDGSLGKLEATLREACVLVSLCQGAGYLRRILRSGSHAEQFRRVRNRIEFYLQLFPVISHIDTTRRLVRILNGIQPPQTQAQNVIPSSSSTATVGGHRSTGNKNLSAGLEERTESFAIDAEIIGTSSHRIGISSSNDIVHHLATSIEETRSNENWTSSGSSIARCFAATTPDKTAQGIPLFEFSELAKATENFSCENKIGEGGFGCVYKGHLRGRDVAIKRCFESSPERSSDFRNEIKFIPKLQHRNIVKLRGYCIYGNERVLVYEYMQNKSLDKFIFFPRVGVLRNWDILFAIIRGISQGILYLHFNSGLNIIHRDLKPSNILLDFDMNPKISDFGTAVEFYPNKSQKPDVVVAGTSGYMAPEYSDKGIYSDKTDVFSFGSLLLEILSGRRSSTLHSRESLSLHEYAWNVVFTERSIRKLIHSSLFGQSYSGQIRRCAHVALLCVQDDPAARPSMSDVVVMLSHRGAGLPTPDRPGADQCHKVPRSSRTYV